MTGFLREEVLKMQKKSRYLSVSALGTPEGTRTPDLLVRRNRREEKLKLFRDENGGYRLWNVCRRNDFVCFNRHNTPPAVTKKSPIYEVSYLHDTVVKR